MNTGVIILVQLSSWQRNTSRGAKKIDSEEMVPRGNPRAQTPAAPNFGTWNSPASRETVYPQMF